MTAAPAFRRRGEGVPTHDWYGVGDTGIVAAEGQERDGLHIWEDAHIVEILDPETGSRVSDGARGTICVTVLFKQDVYPIVRFDTKDVSTVLPGSGSAGLPLRRLAGFQGRSDNMVKLRGHQRLSHGHRWPASRHRGARRGVPVPSDAGSTVAMR